MLSIRINPTCFDKNHPNFRKELEGKEATAMFPVGADAVGMPSTPIIPSNTRFERERYANSNRSIYIKTNPRKLDEEYLRYSMTGLQGALVFGIAEKIDVGLFVVTNIATGNTVTGKQLIEYAVNNVALP